MSDLPAIEADAKSFTFIDAGPGRKSWFSFVLEDGRHAKIYIGSIQAALAVEQLAAHCARVIRDQ
jgi:hypothetical protein